MSPGGSNQELAKGAAAQTLPARGPPHCRVRRQVSPSRPGNRPYLRQMEAAGGGGGAAGSERGGRDPSGRQCRSGLQTPGSCLRGGQQPPVTPKPKAVAQCGTATLGSLMPRFSSPSQI